MISFGPERTGELQEPGVMDPLHRYPERDIITIIKQVNWKNGIRTYPDPETPKSNFLRLHNKILVNTRHFVYEKQKSSTQYKM